MKKVTETNVGKGNRGKLKTTGKGHGQECFPWKNQSPV